MIKIPILIAAGVIGAMVIGFYNLSVDAQVDLMKAEDRITELTHINNDLLSQIDLLKNQITTLQDDIAALNRILASTRSDNENLSTQIENLQKLNDDLTIQLQDLSTAYALQSQELNDLQNAYQKVANENERIKKMLVVKTFAEENPAFTLGIISLPPGLCITLLALLGRIKSRRRQGRVSQNQSTRQHLPVGKSYSGSSTHPSNSRNRTG